MVQLYYGDGKGKTTAAIGAAVRYSMTFGSDRVYFFQFLKNGKSSEVKGLENLGIKTESDPYYKGFVKEIDKETSLKYIKLIADLRTKMQDCGMMVLDEVVDMYSLGVYSEKEIGELIEASSETGCELVLTGHVYKGTDVSELVKKCDYVTCMKKEKHPFDNSVEARKGIEF